jgi:hypothetical protein
MLFGLRWAPCQKGTLHDTYLLASPMERYNASCYQCSPFRQAGVGVILLDKLKHNLFTTRRCRSVLD